MKTALMILLFALMLSPLLLKANEDDTNDKGRKEMNEFHQQIAPQLFNDSWDLLLKPDRSRNDEDVLLNTVHASLYHWRQIGQPINILRGEWMLAHVYTLLGHKDAALYHAENVMRLKEEQNPKDWDLAYCYEAMARVMALRGDKQAFEEYYQKALEAGKEIQDTESRQQFEADMNDDFWFGFKG